MRIGLYGGSFDPVHRGHLLVAEAAMEEMALDRLVFIPAAQSPFKPRMVMAPAALRLRWLRLALAGETRCQVDPLEIDRGGVSYTIDTVREMMHRMPSTRLYWLIGADHIGHLPMWKDAERLASLVEFVVIPRPGATPVGLPARFRLHSLRGWPLGVSSSEIRDRIRKGLQINHLVPAAVADAIERDLVYRGDRASGQTASWP
jgi:nicotinate-nucleotide adenylyltransferase